MRNVSERLLDIQDAIARIMKYTRDGRDRFDSDLDRSIDAILREETQ